MVWKENNERRGLERRMRTRRKGEDEEEQPKGKRPAMGRKGRKSAVKKENCQF